MGKLIYLLTDFGLKDYYVAAIKSVILSIDPSAKIVDITHSVSKWNIAEGAFILWQLIPYIPSDSIVVGVVDPGVGSHRKELVIETVNKKFLVGPDNGLLYPAANREGMRNIWIIRREVFNPPSATFHGRDIFAPIAGYISKGDFPGDYCEPGNVEGIEKLNLFNYTVGGNWLSGIVLHIDDFGNIVTSVPCEVFQKFINGNEVATLELNGYRHKVKIVNTFSDLLKGEIGLLCGSSNLIEITTNRGSAKEILREVYVGTRLKIIK